jgi:hypothetical protein
MGKAYHVARGHPQHIGFMGRADKTMFYGSAIFKGPPPFYAAFFNYGGHQSSMHSIEDLCRRAACKLSSAKFKGANPFKSNPGINY